ncbi:MAG TPA: acetyl-CoA hydrolase, partial [Xanthomonadaceae bacterium]|nr:acetyl-CoA hydrolase [Xanthomonadaceae bacterium]
FVNEYGIADLRNLTDEDCVVAMSSITDAAFQTALLDQAKASKKLAASFSAPAQWQQNHAEVLRAKLAPFRADGSLPDYPLGSDFDAVEQDLVRALGWLKSATATSMGKLRTVVAALRQPPAENDAMYMQRMGLERPANFGERLNAGLLRVGLARSAGKD